MLRRLALIGSVSVAAGVLVFAPGLQRPSRAPEPIADRQVVATPVILGCIPFPAGAAAEEPVPLGARCGDLAHGFTRMDGIAMSEC